MKIPAWLSLAFKLGTAILGVIITAATASPDHFGGKALADDVVFWLGLIVTLANTVYAYLGTGMQPSQTLAGKVS